MQLWIIFAGLAFLLSACTDGGHSRSYILSEGPPSAEVADPL